MCLDFQLDDGCQMLFVCVGIECVKLVLYVVMFVLVDEYWLVLVGVVFVVQYVYVVGQYYVVVCVVYVVVQVQIFVVQEVVFVEVVEVVEYVV